MDWTNLAVQFFGFCFILIQYIHEHAERNDMCLIKAASKERKITNRITVHMAQPPPNGIRRRPNQNAL